ncbi:hypothetical protein C8A00DRAFT_38832 [Chaetomidium leptoderma]|uniref:Uncharacterized protein n=1 Tax=Chaetomidium leptoderma TaxID=669021 RepID=A0AAN6VBV9_9PEZI|nr:hypothetical protein C8A00DRAFT_38832 [Chaetomidium leptoderma]
MFEHFQLTHIPVLFVATATTFGGMWPLFDAKGATAEMGLPRRFSESQENRSMFTLCSGRTTTLGLILFTFYFQNKFPEVDTVMTILGAYVRAVDGYVFYREGVSGKALQRALSGFAIAAWGWFGMVEENSHLGRGMDWGD